MGRQHRPRHRRHCQSSPSTACTALAGAVGFPGRPSQQALTLPPSNTAAQVDKPQICCSTQRADFRTPHLKIRISFRFRAGDQPPSSARPPSRRVSPSPSPVPRAPLPSPSPSSPSLENRRGRVSASKPHPQQIGFIRASPDRGREDVPARASSLARAHSARLEHVSGAGGRGRREERSGASLVPEGPRFARPRGGRTASGGRATTPPPPPGDAGVPSSSRTHSKTNASHSGGPGSAGRLRWARPSHGTTSPEARPAASGKAKSAAPQAPPRVFCGARGQTKT